MRNIILALIAIMGFTSLSQAQIKTTKTSSTTTVKEPGINEELRRKRAQKAREKAISAQSRTAAPATKTKKVYFKDGKVVSKTTVPVITKNEDGRKGKHYKKKNRKFKSKFANGHDNRTKSKHYKTRGHDNRKKSKHHN